MISFYTPQKDFGTQESLDQEMINLFVDGKSISVKKGTSVMRAAAENGVKIPK
ncbi:MAG: formate dehydrogenase, partial [SAR92 clade bacterium]